MANEVLSFWREPSGASGREAELSVLLREHEEARSSERARFVFVRGPAGVGKSHLFGLVRQAMASRGVAVFEGESPREAKRPFGLFASLLEALVDHLSHSGVPSDRLAALSRGLSPLFGEGVAGKVLEDRRLALYDGACELFSLAGRSCPVFLLPDLDAADRASLELFRYLAAVATSPEARTGGLFVASLRDDAEAPAALAEVLSKVSARTLPLTGLDADGIRAFLARDEVAQRLLEATGGNPDAIEELLVRPAAKPVELFLRRVAKLPSGQADVLSVLAAAPSALAHEVLAGALTRLGLAAAAAPAELDALVRAHLVSVKVMAGQPVYRLARESEKAALLDELAARLPALQRALGEELLGRGQLLAASQLLLAVDPAGQGAAAAVRAADALAGQGAHEDAAELFQRALPHLALDARAPVQRKLSQVYAAQGDFKRALRCLLATRRASELGPKALAALANDVARLLIRLGRLGLAERVLQSALGDASARSAATVHLAELKLLRGAANEAVALGEGLLPSLEAVPEQAIALRNVVGKAYLVRGDLAKAEAAFARNFEQATEAQLPQLAALARLNQGVAAHKQGDRERAISLYQAGSAGHRPAQAQSLANLGSIYAESGDFELALDHLSRALQAFSRFSGAREVSQVASNLARLCHFLGDLDRAIELSEHALSRARELGEPYLKAGALLNLGAALADRREPHEAQRLLEEARVGFEAVGNEGFAALAAALKARAHLSAGERAQASAELARRVVDKGAAAMPAAAVEVELVKAELCLGLGDLLGAGRSAARARDALLSKPDLEGPYRVYFLMSRLRLAAGDVAGAQAETGRAARLLDELTARVPAARRTQFLSVPRRAQVLSAVEPELRLPKLAAAPVRERGPHGLVGRSAALARITRQIEPISRSNATVLVRGESGTGKELLAEAIHNLSPRKGMPFIKVNCAAFVEELLLSELFGHEKGSFTGAVRERKGRFELADGGSLFLDEIGDISPKCQVALLRALQEREFERVGGVKTVKVDVRVICATNRDLEALITQGRFRQDLYYRLKGVMLELPSLRERPEDLPELAAHFLTRIGRERGEPAKQLSQDALEMLGRHTWPGNVRELENVLASAAIFADGSVVTSEDFAHVAELAALSGAAAAPVRAAALAPVAARVEAPSRAPTALDQVLPPAPSAPSAAGPLDYYELARQRGLSLKDLRHEVEVQCIRKALEEASGNISEAARLLKMKRSRLSQIVNSEPELKEVARGE
jgi:transcriptional regulator with GAF, ATPase, and Fis domain/tetratricopeptide (TPR) repeat protein